MISKEIHTARVRNGNILTAHFSVLASGRVIEVPQLYWIRARTNEANVLDKIVRCEDRFLKSYEFPMLSIFDGRFEAIIFEGVFSPRELSKIVGSPIVDPRQAAREAQRVATLVPVRLKKF